MQQDTRVMKPGNEMMKSHVIIGGEHKAAMRHDIDKSLLYV